MSIDEANLKKLEYLGNKMVNDIVRKYIKLCKPAKVSVITDVDEDILYVKKKSLENGEENSLIMEGHTVHYDGYNDQARDKINTRVLLPKGKFLEKHINKIDRDEGLEEITEILDGIMKGKEMFVRFFCLGPTNSKFSISALQITDSSYVAHSEDILYRKGYEQFKSLNGSDKFFYLVHSAGKLDGSVSSNIKERRIYVDLQENRVYSTNNQYAGNSLGLKKLCLRLAINKASKEGWLTEHMFISGVPSLKGNRKTYFLGAYPSSCGKTSTAMIPGHTIVGDDITYIKFDENNIPHAVNIENGIFGIIKDVNPEDDPLIYKVLTSPREMIFSNVLINKGKPYWLGMGLQEPPTSGVNHSGEWTKGKTDSNGKEIPISHGNARYTIRLKDLDNVDENAQNPMGVPFQGILYGGRDSDTAPPVSQALTWEHGVMNGASIESETTAATLGAEGVRKSQPMANLDFVVVPLGKYLESHFEFGKKMNKNAVHIFSTNYFLKDDHGKFFDDKVDKKVWLKWCEGRIHGEYEAIETPIGYIPKYEDLKDIFSSVFDKEYPKDKYENEFTIKVDKWLNKLDRIKKFFTDSPNLPKQFGIELKNQRKRLLASKEKYGSSIISPFKF